MAKIGEGPLDIQGDMAVGLLQIGRAITREVRKARRNFQRALQEDTCWRVQASGSTIKGLVAAGRVN